MAIARVNNAISSYLDSGSLTNGSLPSFSFDPGAGSFVILSIAGYRTSSASVTFAPTLDGVAMTAVGTVTYSNLTLGSNASFHQYFVKSGVASGAKTIAGTWTGSTFMSPKLKMAALSYSDVFSYGGFNAMGDTQTGTDIAHTINSVTGRMIVNHMMMDGLSTSDKISAYSGTAIYSDWDTSNGQGVLGQVAGAGTVNLTATRGVSGADWLSVALELIPTAEGGGGGGPTANMLMVA